MIELVYYSIRTSFFILETILIDRHFIKMVVGDFPVNGKIAVVTGGGSGKPKVLDMADQRLTRPGIGLSFVKLILDDGAKILIPDLRLTPEAEQLIKSSNGTVAFMKCDVANWANLEAIPSEVEKAFGKGAVADIWVAGAGVFEPKWSSFLYDEEKDGYAVMKINAEHPIKLTRIAMRSLLSVDKPGVILLISSGAGIVGTYAAALYCATKHAVVGFTKSMAQADVDENVKVVSILPGMVSTPLWTGEAAKHVHDQFSFTDDMCTTSEEVAVAMKEMVEDGSYGGGALMEVTKDRPRNRLESAKAVVDEALQGDAMRAFFVSVVCLCLKSSRQQY